MTSLENLCDKMQKDHNSVEKTPSETDVLNEKLSNIALANYEFSIFISNTSPAIKCRNSPFRKNIFKFKQEPIIQSLILNKNKGKEISFANLCNMMITYIYTNNLFIGNGIIKCDPFLKMVTKCDNINYFELMKNLRHIII